MSEIAINPRIDAYYKGTEIPKETVAAVYATTSLLKGLIHERYKRADEYEHALRTRGACALGSVAVMHAIDSAQRATGFDAPTTLMRRDGLFHGYKGGSVTNHYIVKWGGRTWVDPTWQQFLSSESSGLDYHGTSFPKPDILIADSNSLRRVASVIGSWAAEYTDHDITAMYEDIYNPRSLYPATVFVDPMKDIEKVLADYEFDAKADRLIDAYLTKYPEPVIPEV